MLGLVGNRHGAAKDSHMPHRLPGPSLGLRAFDAQNAPLERFAGLCPSHLTQRTPVR